MTTNKPSRPGMKRPILWVLIICVLVLIGNELRKAKDEGLIPLNDFEEYWAASRIFLRGGNPYDALAMLAEQRALGWTQQKPLMMWNPPWTLPLLAPLSFLPFWTARALWFYISAALVLVAADWSWRQYGGRSSLRWISWIAALFFIPAGTSLFLGQITPLVLAGTAAFLWCEQKKRPFCAGIATLAIAIKPHLLYLFWIFLLFWILRERRWRILGGACAAFAVSSLVAVLVSPAVFVDYSRALVSPSGPEVWQTPTWGIALLMIFPAGGDWLRYLPSAIGALAASGMWVRWRDGFDWQRRFPIICLLSVVMSSFTWMFDWVVLLPVAVLVLCWFQTRPARLWWLVLGFLAIQTLLVLTPSIGKTNFYTIWMPPALWLLYWAGSRAQRQVQTTSKTESA